MEKLVVKKGFFNAAFYGLIDDLSAEQILFGGAGSGKSVFTAQKLVLNAAKYDRNALVVRNTANTLKKSVWNEIISAITALKLRSFFKINKSELTITCTYNQKQLVFVGCNDTERLKSIRPVEGVFHDIWIEEATEISEAAYNQLQMRQRGSTIQKKCTYLTFNPVYKGHWIEKRFFPAHRLRQGVYRDTNRDILIHKSTHRDNRFLTAQDHAKYEAYKYIDSYYYDVYVLGNWGVLGNVIFTNWEVADLSDYHFSKCRYGQDFGFANDPDAMSITARKGDTLYVPRQPHGELYTCGLTTKDLAAEMVSRAGGSLVTCDSSNPRLIKELREYGVHAEKAKKAPGSVLHGIRWLQSLKIIVDEKNQNAINELSVYRWKENADGIAIMDPVDADNHWIDATRYGNEFDMAHTGGGVGFPR